jgi:hypothetical protein
MPRFSIRNPYFIIVICLALVVIGVTSLVRMPVDLFPAINLPEAVVATFYRAAVHHGISAVASRSRFPFGATPAKNANGPHGHFGRDLCLMIFC